MNTERSAVAQTINRNKIHAELLGAHAWWKALVEQQT